jgi:predicted AAA+ superfamily ATPase
MKREIEQRLGYWLTKQTRKPLIIRGARQVGKSTSVRNFCRLHKLELVEINLEVEKFLTLMKDEINQVEKVLEMINYEKKIKILSGPYLLFFDEIQEFPELILALRYFYEKFPQLPIIAAGSLLEFTLNDHDFSMPVGRIEFLHMGPMTFTEYLMAKGEDFLIEGIRLPAEWPKLHHKAVEALKEYFFIGGMPEAIKNFLLEKNFQDAREVHRNIIQTYVQDFPKYTKKNDIVKIGQCFERLPLFLGQKFKYSEFLPNYQSRDIKKMIQLLRDACVAHSCFHVSAQGVPLRAQIDEFVYKLFFIDVGLYNAMLGLEPMSIIKLDGNTLFNKGVIAEQFVAQHLADIGEGLDRPELFYWLRDKKNHNAEVDFVISFDGENYPIEVKSSKSGHLKSLHEYIKALHPKKAIRFHLATDLRHHPFKEIREETTLLNVPLYAIAQVKQLVALSE